MLGREIASFDQVMSVLRGQVITYLSPYTATFAKLKNPEEGCAEPLSNGTFARAYCVGKRGKNYTPKLLHDPNR